MAPAEDDEPRDRDRTRRLDEPLDEQLPEDAPTVVRGTDLGGRGRFADRNLPVAVASGVALAAVFLGSLFWHPIAFGVLVAVIVVIGVVETGRVLDEQGIAVLTPVVLAAALVMLVGAYQAGHAGQTLGLIVLFVGAVAWQLADPERHEVFRTTAATLLLGIWVPFLGSFAILLVRRPETWVAVVATIGVAVVSDIGAYFTGMRFGRRKLAPRVSPGKTWEGVAGGVGGTAVITALILPLLGAEPVLTPAAAFVFAALVAAAGVVGDLAESLVKRDLDVKDFGGMIPGHGGILDRVDAILFALPTGYYLFQLLGR